MCPLCYGIGYFVTRRHEHPKTKPVVNRWITINAFRYTDNFVTFSTTKQYLPYVFGSSHVHKIISKENTSPAYIVY